MDERHKFFVWTDHVSYLAVAHARSVEEARQALEDNDLGGLDGSCPERQKARTVIYNENPAVYHGKNAEFCVIGIDGQEQLEAERDALQTHAKMALDHATRLEAERDALAAQNERFRAAASILFAYGDNNEMTQHPWWAVVQRNGPGESSILAGPFFSREAAERHRKAREYDYGNKSIVFCFRGHWSHQYKELRAILRDALALTPPAALDDLRRRERIATLREAASIASQMEQEDDATAGAVWERLTHMADYQEQLTTDPRADQIRDAREKKK